jgi:hypothetical protein
MVGFADWFTIGTTARAGVAAGRKPVTIPAFSSTAGKLLAAVRRVARMREESWRIYMTGAGSRHVAIECAEGS